METTKINKSLTKAEKRVLIAKDVLKLLGAKRFKAKTGNAYLRVNKNITQKHIDLPLEEILKTTKNCEACALGSLFYAHVNRFNQVKVHDLEEIQYMINNGSLIYDDLAMDR